MQWELEVEEYQRFDCHPEENADEAKCKAKGCIWMVSDDTDSVLIQIYTLFPNSIAKQTEGNKSLSPMLFFSFPTQTSNIERVPWCFYPKDYGYNVETVKESNSGMTIDITRNKKYRSSGRPESLDIDTLRVEIHYHSSDMLQFKVCVS